MIIQNESRQAKIDSWVQTIVKRHKTKTKNKDQPTIIKITKLKNNRKIKGMRNITPIMDHCSRNGQMGETDP